MTIEEIKQLSIKEYLEGQGFQTKPKPPHLCCKSPFSKDKTWSLVIYENTNSFYDWSAGFGGSIIDLAMAMHGYTFMQALEHLEQKDIKLFQPNYKRSKTVIKKQFEYTKYLTTDWFEIEDIRNYASSRGLRNGFEYGYYFIHDGETFERRPSLMFLHRDVDNNVTGAKFRDINPKENGNRFSARGSLGFYILEYIDVDNYGDTSLFIVEGEANANSLWQYFQKIRKNVVVISFGGVGNLPDRLPHKYDHITDRRLVIDYDGDEKLFNERLDKYSHYELNPIKIVLDKGEDINSLYCKNQISLIKHLLL